MSSGSGLERGTLGNLLCSLLNFRNWAVDNLLSQVLPGKRLAAGPLALLLSPIATYPISGGQVGKRLPNRVRQTPSIAAKGKLSRRPKDLKERNRGWISGFLLQKILGPGEIPKNTSEMPNRRRGAQAGRLRRRLTLLKSVKHQYGRGKGILPVGIEGKYLDFQQ